jgi:hypothetical protein
MQRTKDTKAKDTKSEVARFREQQALQEQAAWQGLCGLAAVASHESITARMERGAEHLLKLIEEGRPQEALALMETKSWGLEENGAACPTTTAS